MNIVYLCKMDKLDNKILVELMKNSRIPLTILSKKVHASREVITYRIEKLKKQGIIRGFITEINLEKLGFIESSLFLSIKTKREEELKSFIEACEFAAWSGQFSGVWNFGIGIYGKNIKDINNYFLRVYNKFKQDIIDYRLTIHKKSQHFNEKYLGVNPTINKENKKNKITDYNLDEKDKIILKKISTDSRIETTKLAGIVKLTAPAVAKRIKQLENKGIIIKYSLFIDPSKIKLFQYSIFIKNNNLDERIKLLSHLENHTNVCFVIQYIGDPFLEFGLIIKDPYDLRKILQRIEESFPDNRITETFLIQDEILSIAPPEIIFN